MALIEEFKKQGDFLFRFRSYLPIPLLLGVIAVFVAMHHNYQYIHNNLYFAACFLVSFLGLTVRSITIGFTPKNTSGRNTKQQVADVINTTAMYSIVRHPLYLGNFIMWMGLAMVPSSIWLLIIFALVFWIYYERIMYAEEAFLRNKFGDSFWQWAEGVPAFIPDFRLWRSSTAYFSWKNVIKREHTGFFKIVLIFFVFIYIHEIMINGYSYLSLSLSGRLWFYFLVFALVSYLVIRTIRKRTNLLNVEGR